MRTTQMAECPSCSKERPDALSDGDFVPGSVCPHCGHVEPESEGSMPEIIGKLDDEQLEREISLAKGFAPTPNDPAATAWLRALVVEGARRDYNYSHDSYVRVCGEFGEDAFAYLAALVRSTYPEAVKVVLEGNPSDDIGGTDTLSLVRVLGPGRGILADARHPTEEWDKLTEEAFMPLATMIEIDPDFFPEKEWDLP